MDFREADRRYIQLKQRHDAGEINEEEFDEQLKELMIQDADGRWWAKSRRNGEWHYKDSNTWVRATPPVDPHRQAANGSGQVELPWRFPAPKLVLWILAIFCTLLVIVTLIRGPGPGYFTALFLVLGVLFGYLARRRGR